MRAGEKIYRLVLYVDAYREKRRKLGFFLKGKDFSLKKEAVVVVVNSVLLGQYRPKNLTFPAAHQASQILPYYH